MTPERRPKILIVDDSRTIVALINSILKEDYDTVTASNGLEAIEVYSRAKPDLVLMDVEMPVMDGFEACKKIKEQSKNTFTPIIFITSKVDLQSMKTGLKAGAEDYLTKPFEPEELLARVQAVLRTKKLYNQLMEAYAIIDFERDSIARIQKSLICQELPKASGFNFFADYQPSAKASGDYYDFIQVDEDHLGVLVADVSGHGTPAAVIMAMMRVLIRSFLAKVNSPKEVLETLNTILCENQESGHFITAFYGVIHLPSRMMKFASAGHNPPLLIAYETGKIEHLNTEKGFPLMIHCTNDIEEREILLPLNSKLICYTDGLTEARGRGSDMYGLDRLGKKSLEFGQSQNADELGLALKQNLQNFLGECEFTDDFTLVIVEVEP
ncbi:MAG: SpoIIE family protein phosphatase [Nitrospinae bacterium]|nr:SpoIIE family protein phosphatase [Nitrospinota bacterium]MBL7018902.1 SpoIIE family protein phosphatase [Nitrospinaceae bacterium]